MSRKYTMRSKEEKLAIVKAVLSGTPAQYYENQGIVDHHNEQHRHHQSGHESSSWRSATSATSARADCFQVSEAWNQPSDRYGGKAKGKRLHCESLVGWILYWVMFASGCKKTRPQKNPGSKLPIKRRGQGGKMRHSEVDAAVKIRLSGKDAILCGIAGFSCTFVEISCQSLQTPQTGWLHAVAG